MNKDALLMALVYAIVAVLIAAFWATMTVVGTLLVKWAWFL